MIRWNFYQADAIRYFDSGMKCSFPEYREGLTKWKVKIEDCIQDLCREALFPECSFSQNEGKCAYRIMKIVYQLEAEFKADLTLMMEIGNGVCLPLF
jgi:hypothetical protein